ncbi:MAG: DMT family transporter [Bacteroidota bacterium]
MLFKNKHLLFLHFIVFIWGWAPILGKLISINAFQLVWFRILITLIVLIFYLIYIKQNLRISKKDILQLFGIGAIIAFHWFCFYHAIKISNVSVTLVAFSTATFFTSIVEPIFYKRKLIKYELIFGMVIIGAIAMIFKVETQYAWGIIFGILAAVTSSFFTVFNGLLVRRLSSPIITVYELSGGFIALTIYLLLSGSFNADFFTLRAADWFWLSLLSIIGTAFTFVASVNLMKHLSPYTVSLTINLETIYGIILAYFIWEKDEAMTPAFYLGTLIILATIFGNGLLKRYLKVQ